MNTEQVWTVEDIRELLEYVQALRKQNEDYKAMVIASESMIRNKEAQIKALKVQLWKTHTTKKYEN